MIPEANDFSFKCYLTTKMNTIDPSLTRSQEEYATKRLRAMQRERTHMSNISQCCSRSLNLLLVGEKTHLLEREYSEIQTQNSQGTLIDRF